MGLVNSIGLANRGLARRLLATGLLLAGLSAGCQNKIYDQNKELVDENRALRDQNDAMRRQQAQAQAPMPQQLPTQAPPSAAPPPVTPVVQQSASPKSVEQIGGLETTVTARGNTVVHLPSDVFFDPGQATLKQSAKASLDTVALALKHKYSASALVVEGHTDSTPIRVSKWGSNLELSEARAKAVKQYLVSRGIADSRISTKGFGSNKPRSSDLSKNRRVEIVVMTGQD
jgi:outer membrane protein OmpA-like peptidoglycan-associated protein